MPRFTYTAIAASGAGRAGLVEAPDSKQAAAQLRGQGLFPTTILPEAAGPALSPGAATRASAPPIAPDTGRKSARRLPFLRPVSAKELALFTRQLATLLRAGLPLLRGLEVLARQERNRSFRQIMEELAEGIRSGVTLSEAMARQPRVFDRLYLNMIRAGEMGGVLDVVLDRLAGFQEKSQRLKQQITSAMVYPVALLTVAMTILTGLLIFVVPKFKQIFADLLKGAPLPPLTQFVLVASDAVKGHFLLVLAVGVAAGLGGRAYRRSAGGALLLDTLLIRLPLFGGLFVKEIVARFGRTLGTLLASGVPILPALLITRDTCANAKVAGAITVVHDQVKEGATISRPLELAQVFPPMVASMIAVGEQTGQLPEMLAKIADIYETEVDTAVAGLSSLLEPLLIVLLAVMVGTIVIALFLPIIRIVQLLS